MRSIAASLCTAVLASTLLVAEDADADASEVNILVLRENGSGSAATAQPYIDDLMTHVARANAWPSAKGTYHTKRDAAKAFITSASPHYGILSLGAFLALRGDSSLTVVGQAEVAGGGGMQYYLVSKTHADLAGCQGKTLATNHGADAKFIDQVVAQGAWKLGDFTVTTTTRPVQTLKKVVSGEAECALIDDAQFAELGKIEGGNDVRPVWFSPLMPPMAIVAFGTAPVDGVKSFKAALGSVCTGDGAKACSSAGIRSLTESDTTPYDAVIKAYGGK